MNRNHSMTTFISIALFMLFILAVPSAEAAKNPTRVALLPLNNQTNFHDTILEKTLQKQLTEAFHIPLNGVLHYVEWVPDEDIRAALLNYNPQTSGDMTQLAEFLCADYIAGFVITSAYERRFETIWSSETILESEISLQLIGYDASTGKPFQFNKHDFYQDTNLLSGSVRWMGEKAGQDLLKKINFKQKIRQEFSHSI